MSLTESQIESIADHLRSAGFELDEQMDNDRIAVLAACILEALGVEI